jgi:uncharacterized protein YdaU (DUF1376 family)
MTAPAWMPLYVSTYLGDTGHLSTVEHGAYLLLIMHYWQSGSLPKDDARLSRIVRMNPIEWLEIRPTIADFFTDDWRHDRIADELAKASELVTKRSAAGKAGASARYGKRIGKRSAIATANVEQTNAPIPIPNNKEEKKEPSAPKKNGTRLHEDWKPNEASCARAAAKGFSNSQIEEIAEDLRVWANGKGISRQNWDATFDGFIRREAKQLSQHNGNRKVSPHELLIEAIADHVQQDRDRAAIGETPLSLPDPGYGPSGKPPH